MRWGKEEMKEVEQEKEDNKLNRKGECNWGKRRKTNKNTLNPLAPF